MIGRSKLKIIPIIQKVILKAYSLNLLDLLKPHYLKKKLNILDTDLPKLKCQNFNDWTFSNSVQSISMIYASGFLGNPATFYGHTLLKLNSRRTTNQTKLMDQSINYGIKSSRVKEFIESNKIKLPKKKKQL